MLVVPVLAVPSQNLTVNLNNQPCQISIYQLTTGLFMDLAVNNEPIVTGVICQNCNRIVRDLYLGFSGDLCWLDNHPDPVSGPADPVYTGLGTRFTLMYIEPDELPPGVG